ncbi:hypothetical protein TCAL_06293 [Tigriopus californicus]|uniref:Peptidase S54 rhomboid domain-containing protein n=1 Tax=Tigriopus californicus TaxID=6832 RepID=A0A553NFB8_TIGCA|nr:hypothetical protein TCAL_06293 [Tigriopus californicus]|eukprot:TCALIF_06293-PA protein Name:"Similar to Rhbdd1 Rhomboid-related protein 4 (Mus musculus)" AED:0.06 eAED:0.08 QI:0/0/0/0.5/0/0.5/2/0/512
MRPRSSRRANPWQLGLVLLLYEILTQVGWTNIPVVTLATLLWQTALFLGYAPTFLPHMYTDPNRACLRPDRVIFHGEWHRLWSHAFLHASDIHLYYNMLSFIWKGRDLERRYGPVHFAFILVILTCLSGLVHVGVAWAWAECFDSPGQLRQASIGFSGVLFALKVLAQAGPNQSSIFSLAAWSELFLIQLSVPNASFLGHLSGIIAGLLYVYGSKGYYFLTLTPLKDLSGSPATVISSLALTATHLNMFQKPWNKVMFWSSRSSLVCLSSDHIFATSPQWIRLISAPVEHQSDFHFVICLVSFLIKGFQLEKRRGFVKYILTMITSILGTSLVFVILSRLAYELQNEPFYMKECVQGLSGVLFALKILCFYDAVSLWHPLALFEVFELLILMETRSLLFHVSGLLTGLIFLLCEPARFPGQGIRLNGSHPQPPPPNRPSPWTRSWGYGDYDQGPPANHFVDHGYESIPRYRDTSYYSSKPVTKFIVLITTYLVTEGDRKGQNLSLRVPISHE